MGLKKGAIIGPWGNPTIFTVFLIVALGFAVYANSLNGEFIWDDDYLIKNNAYIRSWSNIGKIFTSDIGTGGGRPFYYYRPFYILTYAIDYSIWGLNVVGYHLTNIILHILTTLCLYWFVTLIFEDRLLSGFTSILFLLHPVQTETVASISVRGDSLSALFMLLCFIFYVKATRGKKVIFYFLIPASCALALFSKENALILPALIIFYHLVFRKKFELKAFLPVLAISVAYIPIRFMILRSVLLHIPKTTDMLQRIPGFFVAIFNYIRLLVLPFNLHAAYGDILFDISEPKALSGITFFLLLLLCAFRMRKGDKLIFFSVGWFFISLIPVSNIIYPAAFYMTEHFLYLPSIGFFLMLAKGLQYLYRTRNQKIPATAVILIVAVSYSFLTIRQNNYWKEPVAFYRRTLKYSPNSPIINNNLGLIYNQAGKYEEAIELFERALKADPRQAEVYKNLGIAHSALDRKKEAIEFYKQAVKIDPAFAEAYFNMANAYRDIGNGGQAIKFYRKAFGLKPDYEKAYYNLAATYDDIGMTEEAIMLLEKAIEINPGYAEACNNLGVIYKRLGRNAEAANLFGRAIEAAPALESAYNNLGTVYTEMGRHNEAVALFKKAIEINPYFADAYYNIGNAYNKMGDKEKAITSLMKAIEVNPEYAQAYNNLGMMHRDSGRIEDAMRLLERALEIDRSYIEVYNNIAMTYRKSDMPDEAVKMYKKAIEIDPGYADTYNNLAITYAELKRYEDAIELFKKVIEIDPKHAMAHYNLALTYLRLERYEPAIEYCDKAEGLGMHNPALREALRPYRENVEHEEADSP